MRPPIVVIDDTQYIMLLASEHVAEKYLERTDVKNGVYRAFDSEGRVLDLRIEKRHKFMFPYELLILRCDENRPPDVQGLWSALLSFLRWFKTPEE